MDFELDGDGALAEAFDELEDDYAQGPVYVVGTNVEYAVYVEFGTEDHPPYPFFRPAIREFRANPESFILDNSDFGSLDEIDSTEDLITGIAVSLENQITTNANANRGGRSPGVDSDHPVVDTSNLVNSISAVRIN